MIGTSKNADITPALPGAVEWLATTEIRRLVDLRIARQREILEQPNVDV